MNLIDKDKLLEDLTHSGIPIFNKELEIIEAQEVIRPPQAIKPLSNSTLRHMTKSEMIEYIRMCEHNTMNAYAQIEQQARNVEKVLKDKCNVCLSIFKTMNEAGEKR